MSDVLPGWYSIPNKVIAVKDVTRQDTKTYNNRFLRLGVPYLQNECFVYLYVLGYPFSCGQNGCRGG